MKLRDGIAIAAAKAAVSIAVLAMGFTHVSDDDYARTVIAESFAHAPKLDPSGTSWLPFPFWITGAAMIGFGRTLVVARAIAIVSSSLAASALYLGARALGAARGAAIAGALVAACTPVCAWLGAATVPEGFTGLVTTGAILAIASDRANALGALGLFACALSRYEAWPACAVAAIVLLARARYASAALAVLGPSAWMIWNRASHGSFVHFFTRVSAFREAHTTPRPLLDRLLENPSALVTAYPESVVLAIAIAFALGSPGFRARWWIPAATFVATLAFLVIGDARGGAPTHHPERALVALSATLVMCGADALSAWPRAAAALAALWTALLLQRARAYPGASPSEDRSAQIARGEALRTSGALEIAPCAYEHFALIAAYGAPERVTLRPPRPALSCPSVALR